MKTHEITSELTGDISTDISAQFVLPFSMIEDNNVSWTLGTPLTTSALGSWTTLPTTEGSAASSGNLTITSAQLPTITGTYSDTQYICLFSVAIQQPVQDDTDTFNIKITKNSVEVFQDTMVISTGQSPTTGYPEKGFITYVGTCALNDVFEMEVWTANGYGEYRQFTLSVFPAFKFGTVTENSFLNASDFTTLQPLSATSPNQLLTLVVPESPLIDNRPYYFLNCDNALYWGFYRYDTSADIWYKCYNAAEQIALRAIFGGSADLGTQGAKIQYSTTNSRWEIRRFSIGFPDIVAGYAADNPMPADLYDVTTWTLDGTVALASRITTVYNSGQPKHYINLDSKFVSSYFNYPETLFLTSVSGSSASGTWYYIPEYYALNNEKWEVQT